VAVLSKVDVTHFFTQQVFNYTDFRDFIGSTDSNATDLLISQEAIGQFSADASQHFAEIIYLNDIRIIFKHDCVFHLVSLL